MREGWEGGREGEMEGGRVGGMEGGREGGRDGYHNTILYYNTPVICKTVALMSVGFRNPMRN